MTQIFIFTAGQSAARAHLDDSIISPVDLSKLEGTFLESTGEQDNLMNRKELENFVGDKNIFCTCNRDLALKPQYEKLQF